MAENFYVWGNLKLEDKVVPVGEKVTQKGLGITDAMWNQLIDARAIRTKPHPKMGDFTGSPNELIAKQLRSQLDELDTNEAFNTFDGESSDYVESADSVVLKEDE